MEKYQISLLSGAIFLLTACGGSDTKPAPTEPKPPIVPTCTVNQYLENNVCKDKSMQTITGLSLPAMVNVGQTINLTAKSSANLAITYTSKTAETCGIQDGKLQTLAVGKCLIEATQTGNEKVLVATPVTAETLIIPVCTATQYLEDTVCKDKAVQVITDLTLPKNLNIGESIKLTAKSSAGLEITYTSMTVDTCAITTDHRVETLGVGACTVEATQAGNEKVLAATPVTAQTTILPILTNTGIFKCGTDSKNNLECTSVNLGNLYGLNQDGEIQTGRKMAYSLVKNGSDECVKDNVTGLMWEQKTIDGKLRDKGWTYNDISAGGSTCGGTLANCSTSAYIKALNTEKYCGYSDWRMPTRSELINIVDYGRVAPAINSTFKNTAYVDWYWTATPQWRVDFNYGASEGQTDRSYFGHIRAVRSGQ